MNGIIIRSKLNDRSHDYRELEEQLAKTRDPQERTKIMRAMEIIRKEQSNPKINAMREALIRAKRNGNMEEIKDIHEFIRNKQEYKNERL